MAAARHRLIKEQRRHVIVPRWRRRLVRRITAVQIVGPLRRVAAEHKPASRRLWQRLEYASLSLEKPVRPAHVSQTLIVEDQMPRRQDDVGAGGYAAAIAHIRLQLAVETKRVIGQITDLIGRYREGQVKPVGRCRGQKI